MPCPSHHRFRPHRNEMLAERVKAAKPHLGIDCQKRPCTQTALEKPLGRSDTESHDRARNGSNAIRVVTGERYGIVDDDDNITEGKDNPIGDGK